MSTYGAILPGATRLARLPAEPSAEAKRLFGLTCDDLVYVLPPDEWDPKREGEEEALSLGINTWPAIKEQLPPL